MDRLAFAVCLIVAGCRANAYDRAPIEARHPWGTVRGYRAADVESVGAMAEELVPRVEAWLQPVGAEPPRIVVEPEDRNRHVQAFTREELAPFSSRIVARFIALEVDHPAGRRYLLAHELVHWYAVGYWRQLPMAVEDGMGDMVACELNPEIGEVRRVFLGRLGDLSEQDVRETLAVSRDDYEKVQGRRKDMLYLVGLRIAKRWGVKRLSTWCQDAQSSGNASIPDEWIDIGRSGEP
jgi:hypothetical protein